MKKFLLLFMMFLSAATIMADDGQKINASKISKITFDGDNVVITFNDGTTSLTADMTMITLDFTELTSLGDRLQLTKELGLEGKQVYDLKGRKLGKSAAKLKKGVYIIDGKKVTIK